MSIPSIDTSKKSVLSAIKTLGENTPIGKMPGGEKVVLIKNGGSYTTKTIAKLKVFQKIFYSLIQAISTKKALKAELLKVPKGNDGKINVDVTHLDNASKAFKFILGAKNKKGFNNELTFHSKFKKMTIKLSKRQAEPQATNIDLKRKSEELKSDTQQKQTNKIKGDNFTYNLQNTDIIDNINLLSEANDKVLKNNSTDDKANLLSIIKTTADRSDLFNNWILTGNLLGALNTALKKSTPDNFNIHQFIIVGNITKGIIEGKGKHLLGNSFVVTNLLETLTTVKSIIERGDNSLKDDSTVKANLLKFSNTFIDNIEGTDKPLKLLNKIITHLQKQLSMLNNKLPNIHMQTLKASSAPQKEVAGQLEKEPLETEEGFSLDSIATLCDMITSNNDIASLKNNVDSLNNQLSKLNTKTLNIYDYSTLVDHLSKILKSLYQRHYNINMKPNIANDQQKSTINASIDILTNLFKKIVTENKNRFNEEPKESTRKTENAYDLIYNAYYTLKPYTTSDNTFTEDITAQIAQITSTKEKLLNELYK